MNDPQGYKAWFAQELEGEFLLPLQLLQESLSNDILPVFANLSQRAEQEGNAYFNRIGSQPVENDDVDMADAADDANALALRWYESKKVVRQTVINLMAVGIYHLVEQQLAAACQFYLNLHHSIDTEAITLPKNKSLEEVKKWFSLHFKLDLQDLESYESIQELRLVANTVKHGEGKSADCLRLKRPDLFCASMIADMPPESSLLDEPQSFAASLPLPTIVNPLGGEDVFVTESDLEKHIAAALSFFKEIAQSVQANLGPPIEFGPIHLDI